MFIDRREDGIQLRAVPAWVVDTLMCLPDWVESDHPDVRARLMPKAYEDEEQDKEWREALGHSLEHLVSSRTEILRKDLKSMTVEADSLPPVDDDKDAEPIEETFALQTLFSVFIPAAHLPAWISTLQAGTHALFILEGLTKQEVNSDPQFDQLPPEKQVAMLRLNTLQEILVSLLED